MKYLFVFCLLFNTLEVRCQDSLTLKSGEIINAKILEITPTDVKYKSANNPNGPLIVIMKSEVSTIKYENGLKELIQVINDSIEQKMKVQGEKDASKNFNPIGASLGTGLVTLLFPPAGYVTATICSSSLPKDEYLNYPNPKLMKNADYAYSYRQQAKRKKSDGVWSTFLFCTIVDIAVYATLFIR